MGDWTPHNSTFHDLLFAENQADQNSRPYPFYLAYGIEGDDGRAAGASLKQLQELGDPAAWQAEHKWAGIRVQLIVRGGEHFVWSRGEELVTDKYPEFQALREVLPDGTVLDGEILAWKDGAALPFAEMQKRIGRKTVGKKILSEVPVVFMAYDIMEHEGKGYTPSALTRATAGIGTDPSQRCTWFVAPLRLVTVQYMGRDHRTSRTRTQQ